MNDLVKCPKIMGVLNVTPDSFHDGGRYFSTHAAVARGVELASLGADILDVGGESTRPGATPISIEEECERIIPVISTLKNEISIPISIDTRHYEVMLAALDAGANIINDVSGLHCAKAQALVAKRNVPVCIMHMQGQPQTMQANPTYLDVVQEIVDFFRQRINGCLQAGIAQENIWLDPGFGFGKTLAHNLKLLANLNAFRKFNCPILIGLSRKTMFGNILNKPPEARLFGTLAGVAIAALSEIDIVRTHDVTETKDVLQVVSAYKFHQKKEDYSA